MVDAKSQHRPLERWLVMGPPSKGMVVLKTWASEILVGREERMSRGAILVKARIARLVVVGSCQLLIVYMWE